MMMLCIRVNCVDNPYRVNLTGDYSLENGRLCFYDDRHMKWYINSAWGLIINHDKYFPERGEPIENFLNRILEVIKKERIEYVNNKTERILSVL